MRKHKNELAQRFLSMFLCVALVASLALPAIALEQTDEADKYEEVSGNYNPDPGNPSLTEDPKDPKKSENPENPEDLDSEIEGLMEELEDTPLDMGAVTAGILKATKAVNSPSPPPPNFANLRRL